MEQLGAIASNALFVAIAVGLFSWWLSRWGSARDRKRERYAETIQNLVAWYELPYRIRRQVSDEPPELSRVAQQAHGLQERLANDQAWVAMEQKIIGAEHSRCLQKLREQVLPCAQQAWNSKPATEPERMNVTDLDEMAPVNELIRTYTSMTTARFQFAHWFRLKSLERKITPDG
jgi:hypothetical protein